MGGLAMTNDQVPTGMSQRATLWSLAIGVWSFIGHWSLVTGHSVSISGKSSHILPLIALVIFCGCTPPGPRALLKGERLIREGKYDKAIESLQEATRLLPRNAQTYNHLGLALHGNKQFGPAL